MLGVVIIKSDNFFISALVIFLLLIVALAIYGGTVGVSNSDEVMPYDFVNFTMNIPKGDFLNEDFSGDMSTFTEQNNEYVISYLSSIGIYDEMVEEYTSLPATASVENVDNITAIHYFADSESDVDFEYVVLTGDDYQVVMLEGNDIDLLKKMASSVKFSDSF